MYEYYRKQSILPTHGSFKSISDLNAYELERRDLFMDKLFLPPRLFQGSRLIEFGPDAGENSLVFARWGASCKLIEPNSKAHSVIKEYFKQFKLEHKLIGLECSDIKTFSESMPSENIRSDTALRYQKGFDFIDAEGFIYTVKPESLWIDLFARIIKDDGFMILFYCETFGNFMELMLKVIHSRVCKLTGMNAIDAARKLFTAKWNSIPHKRPMESWVMDVLENPFVRLHYFLELQSLCKQMHDAGFYLYSSWPPYKDGLNVHWFKKTLKAEEQLRLQTEFIARSRLSHMFGRKHFLLHYDPALEETISSLLTLTDSLIDNFDNNRAMQCEEYLSKLTKTINSNEVLSEEQGTTKTLQTIRSMQHILHLLAASAVDDVITFCNNDQAFIQSWGMPSHFAVFRKGNSNKV